MSIHLRQLLESLGYIRTDLADAQTAGEKMMAEATDPAAKVRAVSIVAILIGMRALGDQLDKLTPKK